MIPVILLVLVVVGIVAAIGYMRSGRDGPPVRFAVDDAGMGVPHDYGDGLRRVNLEGALIANVIVTALAEDGISVRVNGGGGGMLGGLDAPAHIVYDAEAEPAVMAVVNDVVFRGDAGR